MGVKDQSPPTLPPQPLAGPAKAAQKQILHEGLGRGFGETAKFLSMPGRCTGTTSGRAPLQPARSLRAPRCLPPGCPWAIEGRVRPEWSAPTEEGGAVQRGLPLFPAAHLEFGEFGPLKLGPNGDTYPRVIQGREGPLDPVGVVDGGTQRVGPGPTARCPYWIGDPRGPGREALDPDSFQPFGG